MSKLDSRIVSNPTKAIMAVRIPTELRVRTYGLVLNTGQRVVPWQAVNGKLISVPFALASSLIMTSGQGNTRSLEEYTRDACEGYEAMALPVDNHFYVGVMTSMYRHVLAVLRSRHLLLGETDPLWSCLLSLNKVLHTTQESPMLVLNDIFGIDEITHAA